jgi:hypothetical protein
MKRVNTRGIKLANKCMIMAAIAYNLKKMLKFGSGKVITMVREIQKDCTLATIFCHHSYFFRKRSQKWNCDEKLKNQLMA